MKLSPVDKYDEYVLLKYSLSLSTRHKRSYYLLFPYDLLVNAICITEKRNVLHSRESQGFELSDHRCVAYQAAQGK